MVGVERIDHLSFNQVYTGLRNQPLALGSILQSLGIFQVSASQEQVIVIFIRRQVIGVIVDGNCSRPAVRSRKQVAGLEGDIRLDHAQVRKCDQREGD